MSLLVILLIVVLIFGLGSGAYGYRTGADLTAPGGLVGLILVVLVILLLLGYR